MSERTSQTRFHQLAALVSQIPYGRCCSYGNLGKAFPNPVSGFLAGKWMAGLENVPIEVPWWRVLKADGTIALFDRDPQLGSEQVQLLKSEGIPFLDNRVDMSLVSWSDFSPVC